MPIEPTFALLIRATLQAPGFMRPAGQPAIDQAKLGWSLTFVAIGVVIVIAALLLTGIFRTRWSQHMLGRTVDDVSANGAPMPRGIASGMRGMYGGIAITVVMLAGTFAATAVGLSRTMHAPASAAVTIHVIGHQWWWEARYEDGIPSHSFVTANELHIPVNAIVRLTMDSPDVIHSFWIPELAGKTDAIPGQQNVAWFEAKRTGEFRGQCAEYCGLQHAHMGTVVMADSALAFAAWASAQQQVAALPTDSATLVGQHVFVRSCGACHAVRGSEALGVLGPDLTHVASRASIGAGLLSNTRANLGAWVKNAQALKPGVQMPAMLLPPDELNAVVLYLQSLR